MARVTDELLPHEADGIQEYDNPLPRWWLMLFYASIVWAVVYLAHYEFLSDWSSAGKYQAEVAMAAERYGVQEAPKGESLTLAVADPARIAKGKEIWGTYCASCHLLDGTGNIGPDMTDAEWIHGHQPEDMVKVVTEGVLEKGMVAWGPTLGAERIVDVVAYLRTLGGVEAAEKAGK